MAKIAKNFLIDNGLPSNSGDTDFLFNTLENIIYYRDRENHQWVPASSAQQGPPGPQGIQGPAGQDGVSLKIKGHKASVSLLPATGNLYNDAWIVDDTGFLYIWQNTLWFNGGKIVGFDGEQGQDGAVGPAGPQGPPGSDADATAQIQEHSNATTGVHGVFGDIVGTNNNQILTNKAISGIANAITDVPISNVTGLPTVLAGYSPATMQIFPKTSSYQLILSDALNMIEMDLSIANTISIPDESVENFLIGTQITICQVGLGQTTIVALPGVTLNGTPGLKLRARWSSAVLVKRSSNLWIAIGDLSA